MAGAKDILLRPIERDEANALIRRVHYSGKVVNNSQIHLGVFWHGKIEGALQFGPSLDKRKIIGLVEGTEWHQFIELNRMAFTEVLPRNSESRAIAVAMRLLRQYAPQIKWVVSFADACQCGDGTMYRASGFVLTGIKENEALWGLPNGQVAHEWQLRLHATATRDKALALSGGSASLRGLVQAMHSATLRPGIGAIGCAARPGGASSMRAYQGAGFEPLPGFQLRYIYFLDPTWRERLTVPEIPFSRIAEVGASMYRGRKPADEAKETARAATSGETGGASPTRPLLTEDET